MVKRQAPRPRPISRAAANPRAKYMDFAPRKPKAAAGVARATVPKEKVIHSNGIKVSFSAASAAKTVGRSRSRARVARAARMEAQAQADFLDTSIATEEYVEAIIDEEPAEASTTGVASNANNSPFISSVNVDKRPLSARRIVAEETYSGAPDDIREEEFFGTPHAHSYTSRRERETAAPTPHATRRDESYSNPLKDKISKKTVSPAKDKLRSLIMVFAVVLTVVLGVAVGAFIYLAFFQ